MPDPTEKEKNVASQEVAANVESIKKHGIVTPNVKPDYSAVGSFDDYFSKTKVRYPDRAKEYLPVSNIAHYKETGEIMAMSGGNPVTFKGDDAKEFMSKFYTQAGEQREKDYYATKKKISNLDNISNLLNSKNKQSVIKSSTKLPE